MWVLTRCFVGFIPYYIQQLCAEYSVLTSVLHTWYMSLFNPIWWMVYASFVYYLWFCNICNVCCIALSHSGLKEKDILVQALDAALLHYDADNKRRNAKGSKSNGYV